MCIRDRARNATGGINRTGKNDRHTPDENIPQDPAAAAGDGADEHTGEHIAALRNDHKRRRCAEGRKADRIRYVQNTADVIFAQRLMPRIKLVGRKRAHDLSLIHI